jgi:hypothetical protein
MDLKLLLYLSKLLLQKFLILPLPIFQLNSQHTIHFFHHPLYGNFNQTYLYYLE